MTQATNTSADAGPVFIIGTGRSGTTLLYELLANHQELAWISNYTNRWPRLPQMALLSNLTTYAMRGNQLRKHVYVPRPVEGYDAWSACFEGFRRPSGPLTQNDVTDSARHKLRDMVNAHQRWQRKPRFLGKWTGWSRIGFMREVFPGARFIHVMRDGRAVARSLLSVPWWDGWDGPEHWRWGPLPPEMQAAWDQSDRSYLVLAGLQWKLLMDEIQNAARELPQRQYMEVRYEDVVSDRWATLERVLGFCGLARSRSVDNAISYVTVPNMNRKWSTDLSSEQQHALTNAIGAELERLGYPA